MNLTSESPQGRYSSNLASILCSVLLPQTFLSRIHTAHFIWFRSGLIRGNSASRMKLCALFSRYSCVNLHVCELSLSLWNKMKYLSKWKRWQSGVLIVAGNSRYSLETWPSHNLSVRFIFRAVEKLLKIFFWNFAQIFERHLSIHVANFLSLSCIHRTLTTEVRNVFFGPPDMSRSL